MTVQVLDKWTLLLSVSLSKKGTGRRNGCLIVDLAASIEDSYLKCLLDVGDAHAGYIDARRLLLGAHLKR